MANKLVFFGECMLELKQTDSTTLAQNFAGDTFNAAIYAKRLAPALDVAFMSCLGMDPFSNELYESIKQQQISTTLLSRTDRAQLGIYAINTDSSGERSFYYWRKGSAATLIMQEMSHSLLTEQLKDGDVFFFSGISLAILSDEDKTSFISLLVQLKKQGATIAFDLNYRDKLWDSKRSACTWFNKVFPLVDIILPGLDEQHELFGQDTPEQVWQFYHALGVKEAVVKADAMGVYGYESDEHCHLPFKPAPIQVDSTAAGDSFAGSYLASRASGLGQLKSIGQAAAVAREVVQHPGAILDIAVYESLKFN